MKQLSAFLVLFYFCGCLDNGVQPPANPLRLIIEDVTCAEAFLKISSSATEQQQILTLKRGDSIIANITMTSGDTIIIDEGLLPNKVYVYTLSFGNWTTSIQTSTHDTTNSNWSFTLDTLGKTNSYLLDVAIINDTLAYAVGEMYLNDSTGQTDPLRYNLAMWDGCSWTLMRLPYHYQGDQFVNPINTIFALDKSNIWFGGNGLIFWDGKKYIEVLDFNSVWGAFRINKIWASSPNDIFVVGENGRIAHYNGTAWQTMESGTTFVLSDIGGTSDNQIYACGLNTSQSKGIVIKKVGQAWVREMEGGIIDSSRLFKEQLYGEAEGLWIDDNNALYVAGNFLYRYKSNRWGFFSSLPGNRLNSNPNYLYRGYLHAIRGTAFNDILIAGEINTLQHFNGKRWSQVGLPYQPLRYDMFWYACNIKNDVLMAVGKFGGRASIITAKR